MYGQRNPVTRLASEGFSVLLFCFVFTYIVSAVLKYNTLQAATVPHSDSVPLRYMEHKTTVPIIIVPVRRESFMHYCNHTDT